MSLIFWTQIVLIVMFALFAYAILKKKAYFLISGFATRADAEQEELIRNGYPQGVGRLFFFLAAGLAVIQILSFFGFSHSFEIQMAFLFLGLFGGLILLSRKEIPQKRKRAFITSSVMAVLVIGGVSVLLLTGSRPVAVTFGPDSLDISGMYGEEISYQDIQSSELLERMPDVSYKENGFGFSSFAKGWFKTKEYGSALLFVDMRKQPVLLIKTTDGPVFLTGASNAQTQQWKKKIDEKTDAPAD
ncbi:DUF3784 domain-containing protein [Bhargavaea ullalensis]|uniref:Bacterial Pleckstrin homology domain-containing protein n=1 Tax=Bhargavaea ullalensis TaxID=1265685 RepID=A0ABV2GCM8_9BACL